MAPIAKGRVLALMLAGAAALGGAGVAWRGRAARARWQAALREVGAVERRLDERVDERPALWGETTDEPAQPYYDRALSLVADWDLDAGFSAPDANEDEAGKARAALVAEGAEALAALHRGAHAADATRTVDWSRGFELPLRMLGRARLLTRLCELKAAMLLEEGRETEAVGVLLDALQFAGDLSRGPLLIEEMIGLSLLTPEALVEGVADGTLLSLPEEADRRLVAGVSALDRRLGWPLASLEGELVLGARGLEAALRDGDGDWSDRIVDPGSGGLPQARLFAAEHVDAVQGLFAELHRAFAAGPRPCSRRSTAFPSASTR